MFALQNMVQTQGPHGQIFLPPRAPHQQLMQKVSLIVLCNLILCIHSAFLFVYSICKACPQWEIYQRRQTKEDEAHRLHWVIIKQIIRNIHKQ